MEVTKTARVAVIESVSAGDAVSLVLDRGSAVVVLTDALLKSCFPLAETSTFPSFEALVAVLKFAHHAQIAFKGIVSSPRLVQGHYALTPCRESSDYLKYHHLTEEALRFARESGFASTKEFHYASIFKEIIRYFRSEHGRAPLAFVKSLRLTLKEWSLMVNMYFVRLTTFFEREAAFGTPSSFTELTEILGVDTMKGTQTNSAIQFAVRRGNLPMVEFLWNKASDPPVLAGFPSKSYMEIAHRLDFEATPDSLIHVAHKNEHVDVLRFFRRLVEDERVKREEIARVDRTLRSIGI